MSDYDYLLSLRNRHSVRIARSGGCTAARGTHLHEERLHIVGLLMVVAVAVSRV